MSMLHFSAFPELIETGPVHLSVLYLLGRELAVLVNSPHTPGRYRATFDAASLTSEIYAYVLHSGLAVRVRWMVVAK